LKVGKRVTLEGEHRQISCCGRYHCASCAYHRGDIVEEARDLMVYVDDYQSLGLIAEAQGACDFEEFKRGLRWLASQDEPCRGCRFGGGWSWWPDCPVRDCVMERGLDFCHQCDDFPCTRLKEEPLLGRKKVIVETNEEMRGVDLDDWMEKIKQKYVQRRGIIERARRGLDR
jgi:hypothetical protein